LLLIPLVRRVTLCIIKKFSSRSFLQELRDARATQLHYLGGILTLMLKAPAVASDKEHKVRIAWGGGAPRSIWRSFEERFGIAIRECYGMTETSSIVTCNMSGLLGSIGTPLPWFSVRIVHEDGTEAGPGERGEIVVRALRPNLILPEYFDNESVTAQSLRGGEFYTGDLGSKDENGNLYFHGRMTDSVRTKGENVSAYEVETVIARHPHVEECAMIGVPGEFGESDIKIFIKSKLEREIDFPELAEWCLERMASFQIPRYFATMIEFEKTPSERIKKHLLSQSVDDCWDRLEKTRSKAVS
jgi:crotonobetaine/carnitine-CoA ligase